jgi:hypothetical protein
MAAPMPRPAPVMTATRPARGEVDADFVKSSSFSRHTVLFAFVAGRDTDIRGPSSEAF